MEDPLTKINLGDPELELIDPTPNIHMLFVNFDKLFFWSKLNTRVIVRWSKRMYSCAGVCSYEGRGGVCDIALSEPLLKLRPRKDLVETLLHEMIHAYLFITNKDRDRDGHGPNFQAHMHRINKMAGIKITIYHDFHDEVNLYLTHWWRCDGPCQMRKPYFGVIRRTCNRAPGPTDYWWNAHQMTCGGKFTKIKEPEKVNKKKGSNPTLTTSYPDITKYMKNKTTQTIETYTTPRANKKPQPVFNINNKNKVDKNIQTNKQPKEVLKDTSNKCSDNILGNENPGNKGYILNAKIIVKGNINNPPAVNQNVNAFNPPTDQNNPPILDYNGNIKSGRQSPQSANVVETVRNVWVNKQIPTASSSKNDGFGDKNTGSRQSIDTTTPNKHKHKKIFSEDSPRHKIMKTEADEELAMAVLKDVYGKDFTVSRADDKLVATTAVKVVCPICSVKVEDCKINTHLDECLNRDILRKMCKDNASDKKQNTNLNNQPIVIVPGKSFEKPERPIVKSNINSDFNGNITNQPVNIKHENFIDLTDVSVIEKKTRNITDIAPPKRVTIYNNMPSTSKENAFDPKDVAKVQTIAKKMNYDKHLQKTGRVQPEKDRDVDFGYLPSFLDGMACEIKLPTVKIETGDDIINIEQAKCPCCDEVINKPIEQHLDECLAFFENVATIPEEGASASFGNETIAVDDDFDDVFDETQTLNATGTKNPCPCCMNMVEQAEMNNHLDLCLAS